MLVSLAFAFFLAINTAIVRADHTPNPSTVTLAGSFQSELGNSGDWDPTAAISSLSYNANDNVWQGTFNLPAGDWNTRLQ